VDDHRSSEPANELWEDRHEGLRDLTEVMGERRTEENERGEDGENEVQTSAHWREEETRLSKRSFQDGDVIITFHPQTDRH